MSIAPDYVTPEEVRDRQLKVYLTSEAGSVNLWPNANGDGFKLHDKADGLGVADSENTMTSLASGGAILRHQRLKEGDMQLPIQIKSNSKRARNDLKTQLEQVLQPAKGPVYVHVLDPYSGDTRIRTAYYRTGLGQPEWSGPRSALYGITLDYAEPWWRGVNRGRKVKVAERKKPFITARSVTPYNQLDDSYKKTLDPSPHAVFRNSTSDPMPNLEVIEEELTFSFSTGTKMNTAYPFFGYFRAIKGSRWDTGEVSSTADGRGFKVKPGQKLKCSVDLEYQGDTSWAGDVFSPYLTVYFFNENNSNIAGSTVSADNTVNKPEKSEIEVTAPSNAAYCVVYLRLRTTTNDGTVTPFYVIAKNPSVVDQAPSIGVGPAIPFFPVFVYSSVVEGVYTLHIEGDEISWPTWYINPPGEDLLIENMTTGAKLFIEGDIFEPLTIVTDPHNQDIYSETWTKGEWWNKIDIKQGTLFPLAAGENKIKITMVGANLESYVEYSYQEMWRAPY